MLDLSPHYLNFVLMFLDGIGDVTRAHGHLLADRETAIEGARDPAAPGIRHQRL